MARDYGSEYRNYHSRPKQKKRRAGRNAARRKLSRAGQVRKGGGNLRVRSKAGNRSRNSLLT